MTTFLYLKKNKVQISRDPTQTKKKGDLNTK